MRDELRASDWVFRVHLLRWAFWLAIALIPFAQVLKHLDSVAYYHDEHYFILSEEFARKAIVRFGELPTWNPYFCGGVPGLASPGEGTVAPDFVLRLLFGVIVGRRLAILLMAVLGMEGTYWLARRLKISSLGAALAAISFATCGFFGHVASDGWVTFFTFELVPWAIYGFSLGKDRAIGRWIGGAAIAWMLLGGGTYTVPYTLITLVMWMIIELVAGGISRQNSLRSSLVSMFSIGVIAIGFSAIRLLSMFVLVMRYPRLWFRNESNDPATLFRWLAMPTFYNDPPGAHIGIMIIVLALLACLIDKRGRFLLIAAGASFVIAMGTFAPWAPWALVAKLPVYSQLRMPHRFLLISALFLSLGAGVFVSQLEELAVFLFQWFERLLHTQIFVRKRFVITLVAAIGLSFGLQSRVLQVLHANVITATTFNYPAPESLDQPFRQARGNRWDAHIWPFVSLGTLQCFVETPFPQSSRLASDLPAEEWSETEGATVKRAYWSPTRIDLDVKSTSDHLVLLNQNYNEHWHSSVGKVVSDDGLLAIEVPAGSHRITLRYIDFFAYIGGVITLATIALFLWIYARKAARSIWIFARSFHSIRWI